MTEAETPVGRLEIAAVLGVQPNTVSMWRKRGLFPPERWTVNGFPAWRLSDVLAWHHERQARLSGEK